MHRGDKLRRAWSLALLGTFFLAFVSVSNGFQIPTPPPLPRQVRQRPLVTTPHMSLSIPFAWHGALEARSQQRSKEAGIASAELTSAFDPATAVMLGPFAFEVYNDPAPGTLHQQAKDLKSHYLSDSFLQKLYDGSVEVRIASVITDKKKQQEGSFPWGRQDRVGARAMVSIGPKHCSTSKFQLKETSHQMGQYVPMEANMFNAYVRDPWREPSVKQEVRVTLYTEDKECIGYGALDLKELMQEQGYTGKGGPVKSMSWRRVVTLGERKKDKKGPLSSASTVQVELEIKYNRLSDEELGHRKSLTKSLSKAVKAFSPKEAIHRAQQWQGPTGCSRDWRAVASRVGGNAKEAADMEPLCFIEHKGTDTQVKLWKDEKRKRIVVAFRGTDFLQWRDLLTDMKILQEPWNVSSVAQEAKMRTYGSYHHDPPQAPLPQPIPVPQHPQPNPVDKIVNKAISKLSGKATLQEPGVQGMREENQTADNNREYGRPIPVMLPRRFIESNGMTPESTASVVRVLFQSESVSMSPSGALVINGGSKGYHGEDSWTSSLYGGVYGILNAAYEGLMSVMPTNVSAESLWNWAVTPSPALASVGAALGEQSFAFPIPIWGDQGYISNLNYVMESLMTEAINFLSPSASVVSATMGHVSKAVSQVQKLDWPSTIGMNLIGEALLSPEEMAAAASTPQPPPAVTAAPSSKKSNTLMDFLKLDPQSLGLTEVPMVHSGFKQAYLSVREPLVEALEVAAGGRKQLEEEQWRIMCTGHSLGGALATLLCQDLSQNFPKNRITMYNFGAPRVGNAAFSEQYQRYNRDSFRVVNELDVVPRFPPGRNSSIFHYDHVGRTVILGTTGAEISPGLPLWVEGHHAGVCPLRETSQRETEAIQSKIINRVVTGTAYQGHTEATYFHAMNIMERAKVHRPLCSRPPSLNNPLSPSLDKIKKGRRVALV